MGEKEYSFVLDDLLKGKQWRECNKIWGGLLFVKGKCNPIVNEWLDITLTHPEIIIDPDQDEMKNQYPYFALHKHDQVLLVALAYKYKNYALYYLNCQKLQERMWPCLPLALEQEI